MFRKIRSNRDPRDTLFSEFTKELNPYFARVSASLRKLAVEYSWQIYSCMLILLGISMIFSFIAYRQKPVQAAAVKITDKSNGPAGGIGEIYQVGTALKNTIRLKADIESILAKDTLSQGDSVRLEKAIDQLQQINKSLQK
ncbi:MAG: hypothetical protein EOO90_06285 [Pedobacter sp.]|nr:MAG: hypothetical protein EOO90_06285 [Pedobacter sp.]